MIAELHDYVSSAKRKAMGGMTNQSMLFPEPAMGLKKVKTHGIENDKRDTRLPCSHKKEPVDFHRVKMVLRKNHRDVPLCWASHAML